MISTIFAPAASAQAGWLGWNYDDQSHGSLASVAHDVKAVKLWEDGYTGAGIHVAVIDTGVTPVAPLSGPDKVVAVVDLSFEAEDPELRYIDTYGHGTHMAGIIAGRSPGANTMAPSGSDFVGIAPDAGIVSVKVGDNTGAVDVSQVIAAIDWVVQHRNTNGLNIKVLNLSYGTDSTQDYLIDPLAYAVERAWDAGIMVVVAAGNEDYDIGYLANPAIDPYVLAVGDLGRTNEYKRAARMGATRLPDVLAPGTSIESLAAPYSRATLENPGSVINGGQLIKGTGSSQAAAVVSGGAALLMQARPDLSNDAIKALLIESVNGKGVIDLSKAASNAVPADHVQTWPKSDGSGSLEAARGTHHVTVDGELITGEVTVWGDDWEKLKEQGASWSGSSWAGGSWTGSSWAGSSWAGSSWAGSSWAGSSWAGSSWAGSSWAGSSWAGASWAGSSWAGSSWAGSSWAGSAWAAASWQGNVWG